MHKTLMLALALLIPNACLRAQAGYPSSDASPPPGKPPGLATIQGCLNSNNGQYTLTEDDGTTLHRLSGSAKKLGPQVGHEVELAGKPSWRTLDNTPPGGASSVITQYVFEVKSVTHVADTCKSK